MSHQTGITASDHLKSFLSKARDGHIRLLKIGITDEELVINHSDQPVNTWEDDYDRFVLPILEENQPCYIFYRLDGQNNLGYRWLFITYSPDNAPVRQKMLYAGTRSTCKLEFGGGYIKEELFGTTKADVSLEGYKKYLDSLAAPPPLTKAEAELAEVKKHEKNIAIGVTTKYDTLPGVKVAFEPELMEAVEEYKANMISYIQMKIDLQNETVGLSEKGNCLADDLPVKVPDDAGRYHLFRFNHTFETERLNTNVFIYSMPGYSVPVKERMVYSTCKADAISTLGAMGLEINKKLEIDSGSELSQDALFDEVHPVKTVHKQKFAKPKPPPGRGAKRMTKPTK